MNGGLLPVERPAQDANGLAGRSGNRGGHIAWRLRPVTARFIDRSGVAVRRSSKCGSLAARIPSTSLTVTVTASKPTPAAHTSIASACTAGRVGATRLTCWQPLPTAKSYVGSCHRVQGVPGESHRGIGERNDRNGLDRSAGSVRSQGSCRGAIAARPGRRARRFGSIRLCQSVNQDSAGCSPSTFTLSGFAPSTWTSTVTGATAPVAPGDTAYGQLTVSVPAGASAAVHQVGIGSLERRASRFTQLQRLVRTRCEQRPRPTPPRQPHPPD